MKQWLPEAKFMDGIHPDHRQALRKAIILIALLTLGLVSALLMPPFTSLSAIAGYEPLHSLLETIAIVIAMMIFAVGWNNNKRGLPDNILIISCAFFAVGILDFSHMISYAGMPDFITPNTPDKSINFWLAARSFAAIALFAVAFTNWHLKSYRHSRSIIFSSMLILIGLIHYFFLFHAEWVPATFINGKGLTSFKVIYEYILIALNTITAYMFFRSMSKELPFNVVWLFASACTMALSELFFTFYANVTDIYILLGHVYKSISYLFLYRAIFVTAIEHPYKQLHKSQASLIEAQHIAELGSYELDLKTGIWCSSAALDQLFGIDKNYKRTISGWVKLIHPDEQVMLDSYLKNEIISQQQEFNREYRIIRHDNKKERWVHGLGKLVLDNQGKPLAMHGTIQDITKRKLAERALTQLSLAVEQSPSSIVISDLDGNIEYVNARFTEVTGYKREEIIGRNPRILQSGKTPPESYEDMWSCLTRGETWQGELYNQRKDGERYIESAIITPVRSHDGQVINYLAIKEDVSDKKIAEARIENLAHFDQLTGLPNRSLLNDRFKSTLSQSQRNELSFATMFLDLDHFKQINDTLGHTVGDQLLQTMAQRLADSLREGDIVSRQGGDEFVLLFPNTDAKSASKIATKLIEIISLPYIIENHEFTITPSIGISIYPDDGNDSETLMKNADTAMYRVKSRGRNSFGFFMPEMQEQAVRNLLLSNALRTALVNNELHINYQPQVSIDGGHIIGAEALLRWNHPELGLISPAEFIPIAEDSGQIIQIGEWVLHSASKQLKDWLDKGLPPMIMAVNLSSVQFRQPGITETITNILDEVNLPYENLEVELTESVAMSNPESVITIMDKLHNKNIKMSIDDFGTGYSSLSYLKKFKVYKLKIDKSFVQDITDDPDDKAIVSAIINLANSLGIKTIAEGVETAGQLSFLQSQGCDEIQGYYFSKPLTADKFEDYVISKSR